MKLKNGRDSTLSLLENKNLHDLREKQQTQMTLEHKYSPTVARGKEKKSPLSYQRQEYMMSPGYHRPSKPELRALFPRLSVTKPA